MKKFYIFNLIVFLFLLLLYATGSNMQSEIRYTFAGNTWLNPVSGEIYLFNGIILQVLSGIGLIIQLIMVNIKLIKDSIKVK
ncbi:MAG: hypothetical protein WDA47_09250 [Bacilli bacterium]